MNTALEFEIIARACIYESVFERANTRTDVYESYVGQIYMQVWRDWL